MPQRLSLSFTLIASVIIQAGTARQGAAEHLSREQFLAIGQELFEREWKAGEPASPGGDGLGPNFNDVSCVACHHQGGVGGGGPIEKNVDMLSLPPRTNALTGVQLRRLESLHPGFFLPDGEIKTTIVLHRFSTKPAYGVKRAKFVNAASHSQPHGIVRDLMQQRLAEAPLQEISASGLPFIRSQRNTTALFGAALIDAIPDRVLHQLASEQARLHPEISGRVPVTPTGAGHFGWRGTTRRLQDFVLMACGNEVGLRVPGVDQAMTPEAPTYQPAGFDLSPRQTAAMVAFVASLPRPEQTAPRDKDHARVIAKGLEAFHQIGCGVCHVQNPGGILGVYSDLLLHDMGPGLTDPAPAKPEQVTVQQAINIAVASGQPIPEQARSVQQHTDSRPGPQRSPGSAYGGGLMRQFAAARAGGRNMATTETIDFFSTNVHQEWRTPPLWGVQDSGPYLHDGRAATLTEAIVMHGGEAAPTTARFLALDYLVRRAILEFLATLRAPDARR